MSLYRINPIIAVGINAVKILIQSLRFCNIFFQNSVITARIAPNWMKSSKLVVNVVCGI